MIGKVFGLVSGKFNQSCKSKCGKFQALQLFEPDKFILQHFKSSDILCQCFFFFLMYTVDRVFFKCFLHLVGTNLMFDFWTHVRFHRKLFLKFHCCDILLLWTANQRRGRSFPRVSLFTLWLLCKLWGPRQILVRYLCFLFGSSYLLSYFDPVE